LAPTHRRAGRLSRLFVKMIVADYVGRVEDGSALAERATPPRLGQAPRRRRARSRRPDAHRSRRAARDVNALFQPSCVRRRRIG